MRKANPAWKILLAVFSLLLTVFVWERGLEESFNRPSVVPKLTLQQNEMALLAEPTFPSSIKEIFIGKSPEITLKNSLLEIPVGELNERERILLAALGNKEEMRDSLLKGEFLNPSYSNLQRALLSRSKDKEALISTLKNDSQISNDPLLSSVTCFAIDNLNNDCIDISASQRMTWRLLLSQSFPAIATFIGVVLLIRQSWLLFRSKGSKWPTLSSLPLSIVDMVLLVAGGFVVLGEIIIPSIVSPFMVLLTREITSPLADSLKVFVAYSSMTLPPLYILRQQIKNLGSNINQPEFGWLQWKFAPISKGFFSALQGWLMIMPLVLLISWVMNLLIGDQGGSNPLLELVLNIRDPLPLGLLIFTIVVIAPLFEELVFRGVLLPVLSREFGVSLGIVISALVFGIAHLSIGELPPLFVLGIGLAILRLSTGRLFPCVLMHSLWNGITFANLLLLG